MSEMVAKLFLDDLRNPQMVYRGSKSDGYEAVSSFNNDLRLDENKQVEPNGSETAKWLMYESGVDMKNLEFNVHSANPVAAKRVRGFLNNYIQLL